MIRTASDGGVTVKETGETMDGTDINASYTAKYDGKEYPVIGEPWDTISIRRIDANNFITETRKIGGKYHFKGRIVISGDGKTMSVNLTGTNAKGEPTAASIVFDRQR